MNKHATYIVGDQLLPKLKEVLGFPKEMNIECLELRAALGEYVTVKIAPFVPGLKTETDLADALQGFEAREYHLVTTNGTCSQCHCVGFRLTNGLCDGCSEAQKPRS